MREVFVRSYSRPRQVEGESSSSRARVASCMQRTRDQSSSQLCGRGSHVLHAYTYVY